jgi:hypothetical protein
MPEELEQIVRGAYDFPLGAHTRETAQLEPTEASQFLKAANFQQSACNRPVLSKQKSRPAARTIGGDRRWLAGCPLNSGTFRATSQPAPALSGRERGDTRIRSVMS